MNRTFLALGLILLLFVIIGWFALRPQVPEMTLGDAKAIAMSPESQCTQQGVVSEDGIYNEGTKTWWFDFTPSPGNERAGCNPACVVDSTTEATEINWRCTGLIQPVTYEDLLRVDAPLPQAVVTSPLTVTGEARGPWYFEASFPVELLDANGKSLAITPAQAQGEWMTEEYVPFAATLTFTAQTPTGTLVVRNDNPSGLPENAKEVRIPVIFGASTQETMPVKLYYYDPALDQGSGGAQCSSKGLVAVDRAIPKSSTPLKDSIELLLKGELSASERVSGLTSEFPLSGVTLRSATIQNGVATLTFNDPQGKTGGGSCRVSVLWAQIEATAKQFPTVQSVTYMPEELFQP